MINPKQATIEGINSFISDYYKRDINKNLPWKRYIKDREWNVFLGKMLDYADLKELDNIYSSMEQALLQSGTEKREEYWKNAIESIIELLTVLKPKFQDAEKYSFNEVRSFLYNAIDFDPRISQFVKYNEPLKVPEKREEVPEKKEEIIDFAKDKEQLRASRQANINRFANIMQPPSAYPGKQAEVTSTPQKSVTVAYDLAAGRSADKNTEKDLIIAKITKRIENIYKGDKNKDEAWRKKIKDDGWNEALGDLLQLADVDTLKTLNKSINSEQNRYKILDDVIVALGDLKPKMSHFEQTQSRNVRFSWLSKEIPASYYEQQPKLK